MKKRTLLKLLSATLTTPLLHRLLAWAPAQKLMNWAGNIEYSTERLIEAESLAQVQSIVNAQPKLKVLGTRHCFNRIADSHDVFLSLKPDDEGLTLDTKAHTVTASGRMTFTLLRRGQLIAVPPPEEAVEDARDPLEKAGLDLINTAPTTATGITTAIRYMQRQMRTDGTYMPYDIEFEFDDLYEGDRGVVLAWIDVFFNTIADAAGKAVQS